MAEKKEKKSQKNAQHVFEIHTMEKDNVLKKNSGNANNSGKAQKKDALRAQNSGATQKKKEQGQSKIANPFLAESKKGAQNSEEKLQNKQTQSKKSTFDPYTKKEAVTKVNHKSTDSTSKKTQTLTAKKSKNMMHIIMIIFIVLFIIGAIGVVVWIFFVNKKESVPAKSVNDTNMVIEDEMPIMEEDVTEKTQQYSTSMPNYFVFDVESETSAEDISAEFTKIADNIRSSDITDPVSFVVNDKNGNPVAFSIFAISANMTIPQDILSSLEEEFSIYAYNDSEYGVRFGFVINVANPDALQEALVAQESMLPQSFALLFDTDAVTVTNPVFSDGVYGTYPIRYVNLNSQESYSIDYAVSNLKLFIGTTKDTIRAIIKSERDASGSTPSVYDNI